jgi:hypothetical protein
MPRGPKPLPAGTPNRQTARWNVAEVEGWQFGELPPCPPNLSPIGRKAWATWLGSWWASFYSLEDLPGLELLVTLYDDAMTQSRNYTKLFPLMDRYGITPKARQELRWAQLPAELSPVVAELADEVAERRRARRATLS